MHESYYITAPLDSGAFSRIRKRARRVGAQFTSRGSRAVITYSRDYPGEVIAERVVLCDAATHAHDGDDHAAACAAWL